MQEQNAIKCIVWDLDNTVWDGILLEGDNLKLKPGIVDIIKTLDRRGILNSIASKGHQEDAMQKLKDFQIDKFFLYPQITWNAKSQSIAYIQKVLNISMDSLMFIDDTPFEREEVKSVHPEITCLEDSQYVNLLSDPRLNPRFITKDSANRRLMYIADKKRKDKKNAFKGPQKKFLATLKINFIISEANENDLKRAEELTIRTNQLNATGITYSYDELKCLVESKSHKVIVCEMNDKYGSYGKIGLALVEIRNDYLHIKLLLFSCRVMSAGVGTVLLNYLLNEAHKLNKKAKADFIHTGKNRMMYATYKFSGFKETEVNEHGTIILVNSKSTRKNYPKYIKVIIK